VLEVRRLIGRRKREEGAPVGKRFHRPTTQGQKFEASSQHLESYNTQPKHIIETISQTEIIQENNMGELVVAIRAAQALIIPSVIIATVVNESKPDQLITIQLDDVDALKAGKDVVIELTLGGAAPVRGGEAAIKELLKRYPSLHGKQSELVCCKNPTPILCSHVIIGR
jgi:hypothetical protein